MVHVDNKDRETLIIYMDDFFIFSLSIFELCNNDGNDNKQHKSELHSTLWRDAAGGAVQLISKLIN